MMRDDEWNTPPSTKEVGPNEKLDRLGRPYWKSAETIPRNGQLFRTKRGHIMRWQPYKKGSAEYIAGITGRFQIYRHGWANAVSFEPCEWHGHSFAPKTPKDSSP